MSVIEFVQNASPFLSKKNLKLILLNQFLILRSRVSAESIAFPFLV